MLRLLILQDGTSSSGVNVETFGGIISTSGGKVDTGGGEVTTGKITTTGDIAIGGKITSTNGNNLLQSQVSGGDSILKAQSADANKPALKGITTINTGSGVFGEAITSGVGVFGKSSSGPGIQGEGNPGLKTTEL